MTVRRKLLTAAAVGAVVLGLGLIALRVSARSALMARLAAGRTSTPRGRRRVEYCADHLDSFTFMISFRGPGFSGTPFGLLLSTDPVRTEGITKSFISSRIDKEQAEKIIAHLAEDGFFDRAADITPSYHINFTGPFWETTVDFAGEPRKWNSQELARVKKVRSLLEGDAAKAMDKVLDILEQKRHGWEAKQAQKNAPKEPK